MMALEPINSYNDFYNMILLDENINTTQSSFSNNFFVKDNGGGGSGLVSCMGQPGQLASPGVAHARANPEPQERKKRRRRTKMGCKNKEGAKNQRMTHIRVERNRRKLMNDHLCVLKSLMPQSYAQRGDQASIVGGAIEYVKELEHLVHSLEAKKLQLLNQAKNMKSIMIHDDTPTMNLHNFVQDSQSCNNYTSKSKTKATDIEVTLIETHANIRIFSKKTRNHLSKLVSGLQTLGLVVLHRSVTSIHTFVLYSISAKVEERCQLTSVYDTAKAIHHMLKIIEKDVWPSLA